MLLVAIAAALLLFAGYSWGRIRGYDDGRNATEIDAPSRPSAVQVVVLSLLGAAALGSAVLLQGRDGLVRMPTPARLDELAGRAEGAAVERAEAAAQTPRSEPEAPGTPPEPT